MTDDEKLLYNSVHPYLTGPLYVEFLDLSFPGLRPGKILLLLLFLVQILQKKRDLVF